MNGTTKKVRLTIAGLAISAVLATVAGATTVVAATTSGDRPSASVIIRTDSGFLRAVSSAVRSFGGTVTRRLRVVHGVAATLPAFAVDSLRAVTGVVDVSTDAHVSLSSTTTTIDPVLGYDPKTDRGSMYLANQAIGSMELWKNGFTGQGIDVALIDSGIAPVPELDGRIVYGPDLSLESQKEKFRSLDTFGHGTHMAGLIAGRDPRATSTKLLTDSHYYAGVAPGARIVSVKAAPQDGSTDVSEVIAGIGWVVEHAHKNGLNIRVLNLSFGTDSTQSYKLDPLAYAAEVAWRSGIVVVVASGNSGGKKPINDPAMDPFVIAVGAAERKVPSTGAPYYTPAGFSTRGADYSRQIDFIAPGRSMISLRSPGSYLDTKFGDRQKLPMDFFRGSGTSQAAAVTSGAVALLLSAKPDLTNDQVKGLLLAKAKNTPLLNDTTMDGHGLLNIKDAWKATTDTKHPVPNYTQNFDPSTGLGSLDAARGSIHLLENGQALTGEQDIFGRNWHPDTFAAALNSGTAWTGGLWLGDDWTGDGYGSDICDAQAWDGRSWTGHSWTGEGWDGRSWTARNWDGHSWTGDDWSGSGWSGGDWTGTDWQSVKWAAGFQTDNWGD